MRETEKIPRKIRLNRLSRAKLAIITYAVQYRSGGEKWSCAKNWSLQAADLARHAAVLVAGLAWEVQTVKPGGGGGGGGGGAKGEEEGGQETRSRAVRKKEWQSGEGGGGLSWGT